MHNAQNGICNIFEGALAISYEELHLGTTYTSRGKPTGELESHYWPLLGDPSPFWVGRQIALR